MKRYGKFFIVLLLLAFATMMFADVQGPFADKVYFNVKMSKDIGIQDTIKGLTDIFYYGVEGPDMAGISKEDLAKLDIYNVPAGSWSILVNPYPNKAPYIATVDSKDYFNPFAIKAVRYAMNFLIDRKYIVDEILNGAGGPLFTPMTPGQPGTYRYNLIPTRLGMTPEGNEQQAIIDITEALKKAAELPELKGKLVKTGDWWTFNGEPVSIKFLIRVDDPGRTKEGEYIANQIEKAGIKVERLMWDRSKAGATAYYGNPADYEWNLYTEGWGAGATRRWWGVSVTQMYAPYVGFMPGGGDPANWNYENAEIDRLGQEAFTGQILTEEEYWNDLLKATELGLEDAVRFQVCYQDNYYVANKDSFLGKFVYGMGDGLNQWSLITANTKDQIVRATEFSARGALFMGAWDPVGVNGFNDTYALYIAEPLYDDASFESPVSAINTPLRVKWSGVRSDVSRDAKGSLVGNIDVPLNAIRYDSGSKTWKSVGPDVKSFSVGTYTPVYSNYHDGMPMNLASILYSQAFVEDWMTKDGTNDAFYNAEYDTAKRPDQKNLKGLVLNDDGSLTVYFDFNFPPSMDRVAAYGAGYAWVWVLGAGYPVGVSWDILEALSLMVAEGSESGTVYSFSADPAYTEVDLLVPSCVKDIRAKLVEMRNEKHVPVYIQDYMTPDQAVQYYDAAIKWIDDHGHAFISEGPFYLNKYDPTNNFIELEANRDPSYPFTGRHWLDFFKTITPRIDSMEVPTITTRGSDIDVGINVSQVTYPDGIASPLKLGTASIVFIAGDKEYTFDAKFVKNGYFEAVVPGNVTKDLESGSYTIIANAAMEGAVPSSNSASVILY